MVLGTKYLLLTAIKTLFKSLENVYWLLWPESLFHEYTQNVFYSHPTTNDELQNGPLPVQTLQ